MAQKLPVKYLSYENLRSTVQEFSRKHGLDEQLPVLIEEFIDGALKIDIVPVQDLQADFAIDACLASDLATIHVDAAAYRARSPNRYRFSLAHELAHLILHREVYRMIGFQTVAEWIEAIASIRKDDRAWIEWQADAFAGLLLVPPGALESQFDNAMEEVRKVGLYSRPPSDVVRDFIPKYLADVFGVSSAVIDRRLRYDELWDAS